jgi:hypothetical protein
MKPWGDDPDRVPFWVYDLTISTLGSLITAAIIALVAVGVGWFLGLPATVALVLAAFVAGVAVGLALAILAARRQPKRSTEEILERLEEMGVIQR